MARILGITIPDNKRIETSLTYLYGVGNVLSKKILSQANIDINKRTKDLSTQEIERIRQVIEKNYKIEGDLRMEISQNIKRLKEINVFRGIRHSKGLPVRGQRTKTNSRTKRGKRVCVGSGRRDTSQKT